MAQNKRVCKQVSTGFVLHMARRVQVRFSEELGKLADNLAETRSNGAGPPSRHRSVGFGESVREWFRMMKDRFMGKWQEWFGDEEMSTPSFTPQDILDIDKALEKRIEGYPTFFTDLWEKFCSECDTDEWDFKSWMPTLPSFPNFDWTNIFGFGNPELPTTVTPRTEFTTVRRATTLRPFDEASTTATTQTEQSSVLTTTTAGTTVPIAESTATPVQSTPLVTQVATTAFTEPTVTSTEEIPTSNESTVINDESSASTTESIITPTEPTITSTEEIVTSNESTVINGESSASTTESIVTPTEPILMSAEPTTTPSTESIAINDESGSSATFSTEPILTPTESTIIASESTMIVMSEEVTTTESPTTPFDLAQPVYSKRIEDNETIEKSTKRPKNRPSSVEVIM
ncbi:zonadhesin-like isoform X2 [Odontomachus brunneus]|uniref:zonadhesin-like isoform X2 n=1 Tax=Odontomachus brunneus TaxID=486640 RepID=UPI0013F1DDF5|nr:zonadhesin-like isoform X2 [Odontomachus brunneus]